jgi:hypothetical protein
LWDLVEIHVSVENEKHSDQQWNFDATCQMPSLRTFGIMLGSTYYLVGVRTVVVVALLAS